MIEVSIMPSYPYIINFEEIISLSAVFIKSIFFICFLIINDHFSEDELPID